MAYGGEIFGNNNPSPYQIARDYMDMEMQERRLRQQELRAQAANDAKVSNAIKATFDKNHLSTGTAADPVINAMLAKNIEKYAQMYKDSKGALDQTDIMTAMQGDMIKVKAYYDNVNVVKANARKAADEIAKKYPGFNAQELYQKAMDRALFKDGQVIQNMEDFDMQRDFVSDVVDNDYRSLNIGNNGLFTDIQKQPLTTEDQEIVTRNKSGFDVMHRGRATFNPNFQEVTYDKETGQPRIGLKTISVEKPDGTQYLDKLTGKPVNVLDEEAYNSLINNRQFRARVYQLADNKFDELQAKGVQLDESDREIFRREVATNELEGNFKNRTNFISREKHPLPRGHSRRVGKANQLLPFDLDAAPTDAYGNKDITGQLGNFTVKDETARGGSTPAEVWLTPRGGLLIRTYELDHNGNRIKTRVNGKDVPVPRPDRVYYGQAARYFIVANSGFSGNSKKDLFKLLDAFDGSGEQAPEYGGYAEDGRRVGKSEFTKVKDTKPESKPDTPQSQPATKNQKKKLSW